MECPPRKWQFWIDRGGTFTDVIARRPDGSFRTRKLLSENPEAYDDAALQAIREFFGLPAGAPVPRERIGSIKMGTTIATNALLERKGVPVVLVVTEGLGDVLEIAYQDRPKTFALKIEKPTLLYSKVIEIEERIRADGTVLAAPDAELVRARLQRAYDAGLRSVAIVFMHAYAFPAHEKLVGRIATNIGFEQVSMSHDTSPLTRIVSRGDTTVVDAYLTPILRGYVDGFLKILGQGRHRVRLFFMQSSGGLASAERFRGRDAILSGPAGGVVGAVHVSRLAGFDRIVGFDMGGTSTDVTHCSGEYERVYETEIAGVRMRVPMLHTHTVAAGGGSILRYDSNRFRVGPDSAGANPGPCCYRRGGPLTVTDINACLGKIQPDFFPQIFGPDQDQALDAAEARAGFEGIAREIGDDRTAEEVAEGFLSVAVEHMAQAVKKISVERGYDLRDYALTCLGGAAGQHACLVADQLNIRRVLLHPFTGILSAYGIGLAAFSVQLQRSVERPLDENVSAPLQVAIGGLQDEAARQLADQRVPLAEIRHQPNLLLRYRGTDTTIEVPFDSADAMRSEFEARHARQFGFVSTDKEIIVESISLVSVSAGESIDEAAHELAAEGSPQPLVERHVFSDGRWRRTPVYRLADLSPGHRIDGPAIIVEPLGTIVVEPNWSARVNEYRHIVIEHIREAELPSQVSAEADPVMLEVFHNRFMSIAEQMGIVLRNTSLSVNIKERLDFSCAIFDADGELVANAPHVPVHLGSMDASVKVLATSGLSVEPGDSFVHNNPYDGGSHLPDVTVITPVFDDDQETPLYYVASRAHHADIGGSMPASMPPHSTHIDEEGVVIDCMKLVAGGSFQTEDIVAVLGGAKYPARSIEQNIADLMAQVAANNKGLLELRKLTRHYGLQIVRTYMKHIQDNAEECVRRAIARLRTGAFEYQMDSGACIRVSIEIDAESRSASIDFSGTSEQQPGNFNAPRAITNAAVLYVFRCLVDADIPLNSGCMKPLQVIVPDGTMLSPRYPAAVVAGNVEVSQAVTNALFGALEALSSSQGTMNNLTFGNDRYQYYETICSGAPAGPGFDGAHAVHTHMTNSRLTDAEILEARYPVLLERFSIRRGSGGRGKWCAGDGVVRHIRFLEPMNCAIVSSHRTVRPFGVCGGEPGATGRNTVIRRDGRIFDLGGCGQQPMDAGDSIVIETPTGGGFGAVSSEVAANGKQQD